MFSIITVRYNLKHNNNSNSNNIVRLNSLTRLFCHQEFGACCHIRSNSRYYLANKNSNNISNKVCTEQQQQQQKPQQRNYTSLINYQYKRTINARNSKFSNPTKHFPKNLDSHYQRQQEREQKSIITTSYTSQFRYIHVVARRTITQNTYYYYNMGSAFSSPQITYELLKKQNAETSSFIIEYYNNNREFDKLSAYEGQLTVSRDNEDGEKLQKGIDYAKAKGVIDPNYIPEPYVTIDVLGKTPDQVADEILQTVEKNKKKSACDTKAVAGSVIVIVGLSGTGKGTTVSCLRSKLEANDGTKVITWSNGNIFRSVTLLASTWVEQNNVSDLQAALTKDNIASFVSMLHFGLNPITKQFDTKIDGLGITTYVSEIENTDLKQPKVSKNIPTVAEVTQGEVILFAAAAMEEMEKAGITVLLEGREQTVNYVRSPNRFTLTLSDDTLIGKRRAAQRIMGETIKKVSETSTVEEIEAALNATLQEMAKDFK